MWNRAEILGLLSKARTALAELGADFKDEDVLVDDLTIDDIDQEQVSAREVVRSIDAILASERKEKKEDVE